MTFDKRVLLIRLLMIWVSFVFLQSLFFKFQGHEETEIIFDAISQWMAGIGPLAWAASLFGSYGGWAIGIAELIAVILLWMPKTIDKGAALGLVVMSGAIFFHLFTPLGVDRVINIETGDTDGGELFYMACSVWVCCALILFLRKN